MDIHISVFQMRTPFSTVNWQWIIYLKILRIKIRTGSFLDIHFCVLRIIRSIVIGLEDMKATVI